MPYNPNGSFSILNEIGTGYACNNALVPLLGSDLDDIATSISMANFLPVLLAAPGAWTAYTPNVVATAGAFTTVSATGAYFKFGRMVSVRIIVTITDIGTTTNWYVTLPFASTDNAVFHGNSAGFFVHGIASSSVDGVQNVTVFNPNSTIPLSNSIYAFAGTYESTT